MFNIGLIMLTIVIIILTTVIIDSLILSYRFDKFEADQNQKLDVFWRAMNKTQRAYNTKAKVNLAPWDRESKFPSAVPSLNILPGTASSRDLLIKY